MSLSDWLQRRREKKRTRERDYFVSQLKTFVTGAEEAYDWDDFESIRLKDPKLEGMRQSILECGLPPMTPAQQAASSGKMKTILEQLEIQSATSA